MSSPWWSRPVMIYKSMNTALSLIRFQAPFAYLEDVVAFGRVARKDWNVSKESLCSEKVWPYVRNHTLRIVSQTVSCNTTLPGPLPLHNDFHILFLGTSAHSASVKITWLIIRQSTENELQKSKHKSLHKIHRSNISVHSGPFLGAKKRSLKFLLLIFIIGICRSKKDVKTTESTKMMVSVIFICKNDWYLDLPDVSIRFTIALLLLSFSDTCHITCKLDNDLLKWAINLIHLSGKLSPLFL